MNYRRNYDTFDEILFRKILDGGSIKDELAILRRMAKDCIYKAKIAAESKNVIELLSIIRTISKNDNKLSSIEIIFKEIQRKYDIIHDDLFIVAAFENYAKAELISKKYLVHRLSKPSKLAKKQKIKPIHFLTLRSTNNKPHVFIENYTVGINILLQPEYVKAIGISQIELGAVEVCRRIRNSIHFGGPRVVGYNLKMLEGLAPLRDRILS